VAGEKAGATKINAAKNKGVEVLTEDKYLSLIQKRR
jgi:BRCT domain type II-containing protein